MDWDRVRIFHTVAEAGSFTHAGEILNLSQSAVSRQVSTLEEDLKTILFHRHARGLLLTEQGELLYQAAHDVVGKLALTEAMLKESTNTPRGELTVTAPLGIGSNWLTVRLKEFIEYYPQIDLQLVLTGKELDLGMREADIAIRLRAPVQPDLIQRKLMTVHHHIYASHDYLNAKGTPASAEAIDDHNIIIYGERSDLVDVAPLNWLETLGRKKKSPRKPVLRVNNINGVMRATESGLGIAVLPDYLAGNNPKLVRILPEEGGPTYDIYFVYPEEMRKSKRINVFRDFLVRKVSETAF